MPVILKTKLTGWKPIPRTKCHFSTGRCILPVELPIPLIDHKKCSQEL
ncbi:MAG: hypothetical protein JWN70_626 [Planctomycetaceae bacterium]|nr:hypothetical protein [Planctomycetaceae bacterium]